MGGLLFLRHTRRFLPCTPASPRRPEDKNCTENQTVLYLATQGEVLYPSLEDSFQRIQSRLLDLTEDAPQTLHFAIMADTLKHGLEQQIEQFLTDHPATKLVVIDTLQRVRSADSDSNLYANDYQDIGLLKQLADKRHIAILLIHHLRKLHDDDPMNILNNFTIPELFEHCKEAYDVTDENLTHAINHFVELLLKEELIYETNAEL